MQPYSHVPWGWFQSQLQWAKQGKGKALSDCRLAGFQQQCEKHKCTSSQPLFEVKNKNLSPLCGARKNYSSLLGAYEPQPFPLWCPPSSRYRCWPILASVPATSLQLCDEDKKACPGQPLDGALGHAHVLWRPCCFTIWLFV